MIKEENYFCDVPFEIIKIHTLNQILLLIFTSVFNLIKIHILNEILFRFLDQLSAINILLLVRIEIHLNQKTF